MLNRKTQELPDELFDADIFGGGTRCHGAGAAGLLLQSAPLFFNPLFEAGAISSGVGIGMLRGDFAALSVDYVNSNHGLHKAVFLLPRDAGNSARDALAALRIPVKSVPPQTHPTFPKSADLLRTRVSPGKASIPSGLRTRVSTEAVCRHSSERRSTSKLFRS